MTDYNDGKWHGWNGGYNKPETIHDKSIIEYIWHYEKTEMYGKDKRVAGWDENDESPSWDNILKFRVVNEYKEPPKPREFWILTEGYVCTRKPMSSGWIHVREVL